MFTASCSSARFEWQYLSMVCKSFQRPIFLILATSAPAQNISVVQKCRNVWNGRNSTPAALKVSHDRFPHRLQSLSFSTREHIFHLLRWSHILDVDLSLGRDFTQLRHNILVYRHHFTLATFGIGQFNHC